MSPSNPLVRLSRQELDLVVEALAGFPVSDTERAHPFLRAFRTFRKAETGQPFEATVENLEAALQALVSHMDQVTAQRRDAGEELAAKIASTLLARTKVQAEPESSEVFINRHPIYQPTVQLFAYELLAQEEIRNGGDSDSPVVSQTILNRFTEPGLDQLVGTKPAFISVPRRAIVTGQCEALPKERIVLEVLDGVNPDSDLFQALARLSQDGFRLAIADSLIRSSDYPLASVADFVRLDLSALGRPAVEARLEALRGGHSKFVAEGVESHEDYEFAQDLEFDYVQGYFFCKPHVTGADFPANRLATMRLLVRLQDPAVTIRELDELINQDLPLAYKLLRFANSAYVGLPREVESVSHAVSMVGVDRIRIWATLLMFSKMEDKPRELMITAVVRARMCESLAEASSQDQKATFFTVGLFSVLDAVLDCPMAQALELLPISQGIRDALLDRKGRMGEALNCVLAYERGGWEDVGFGKLSVGQIRDCYLDTLGWTKTQTEGLSI